MGLHFVVQVLLDDSHDDVQYNGGVHIDSVRHHSNSNLYDYILHTVYLCFIAMLNVNEF